LLISDGNSERLKRARVKVNNNHLRDVSSGACSGVFFQKAYNIHGHFLLLLNLTCVFCLQPCRSKRYLVQITETGEDMETILHLDHMF